MKFNKLIVRWLGSFVSIIIFSLFSLPGAIQAEESSVILVDEWVESSLKVYDFIAEAELETGNFSFYDLAVQQQIQNKIEDLKKRELEYIIDDPLLILNPYGTITNALYVYFESEQGSRVDYSIETLIYNQAYNFKQTAVNYASAANTFEFQLIGLVPNLENKVTLSLYDADDNLLSELEFTISAPRTESFYPSTVQKRLGESSDDLIPGLYIINGVSGFGANSLLFDNDGIIRAEFDLDAYRFDHLEIYKGNLIYSSNNDQLAVMNPLGKITQVIELEGYNLHHDFIIGREDELLVLASINDAVIPRREDLILQVNLITGEVEVLVDLIDVLPEYYLLTTPSINSNGKPDLDWIHINSIEKVSHDEILLSSRETSTIIKLSNIFDSTTDLDYLIGPDNVWEETSYANYQLKPEGNFSIQAGQHSLNLERDPDLNPSQYYLSFYNNNYWRIRTRPELESQLPHENISLRSDSNFLDRSFYYKYLIDEVEKSFELVESIEVPYSSIVSNIQPFDNNIVINSGKANVVGEYDSNGKLIAEFLYPSSNFVYRVFKEDFNNLWFR